MKKQELYIITYTGELVSDYYLGELDLTPIKTIYGVVELSFPHIEDFSSGEFHLDITYNSTLTDRGTICQQIMEQDEFSDVRVL